MPEVHDGPRTPLFSPVALKGNTTLEALAGASLSKQMVDALPQAPSGACTGWGIPFEIGKVILLHGQKPVSVTVPATKAPWLVFMHTSDIATETPNKDGFYPATRGRAMLNEHVADYVACYSDGTEARLDVRRRHHIGMISRTWGDVCFEAVAHRKPHAMLAHWEQPRGVPWAHTQMRVTTADAWPWTNWLRAVENPHPAKTITGFRFEPKTDAAIIVSAVSAGKATAHPFRWLPRAKAVLKLPPRTQIDRQLDDFGLMRQLRLDMGQIISAKPRAVYPNDEWARTYNNKLPQTAHDEIIVEYAAHPDARFHFEDGTTTPVAALEKGRKSGALVPIARSRQRVTLRVVEKTSKKPVAVKLHVHGEAGEYLAPVDRNRNMNPGFFEDTAPDFSHMGQHHTVYINGETVIDLPLGNVYVEVSKGFEIRPVRKVLKVTPRTRQLTITIERVLPWREKGWITADTHVHVLSPHTALLEGAGEGVNVTNLLAVQMGEWMVNAGDFDGYSTLGTRESGGDGEHLLRVGTENRQHVLGHISLLGYKGNMIVPMSSGGPDEAALGDPIDVLLTEWARQCHKQGGLVIQPHFPNPRAEYAASIVAGDIDAIEATSWGALYAGIDPYTLSDWYRFLNCGYYVAAVGGTDKMSCTTPVGAVRTYAKLRDGEFTYQTWMDAVKSGNTFVTYGPLMEFAVEGKPAGARIAMSRNGGTVSVHWDVASVTVPITSVELVVNGEIYTRVRINPDVKRGGYEGYWPVKIDRSSWLALLVRGKYRDTPEMIAAHSSPVMVDVEGSPYFAAADALTILEQIEGVLAYYDTLGTRAETKAYKRMRLVLTSAHRQIHNRLHQSGHYHEHTPTTDHREHHVAER